jgi:ketosteroid isomerase-like protein
LSPPKPSSIEKPEPPAKDKPEPPIAKPKAPAQPERPTAEGFKLLLSGWLAAWNARDKAGYFGFYAEDFYFAERKIHLKAFKKYRGRLMSEAKKLKVSARNVQVKMGVSEVKVTFIQEYASDSVKDRGQKTLVFKPRKDRWLIVAETFQARP